MGNAYFMILISLFVDGVFGAQCSDPLKMRELMEGDAILLDTCVTKIQKEDEVEWKFGPHVIASIKAGNLLYGTDPIFKDKLRIDEQTGDLTIRNTRTEHTGVYEVKITSVAHTADRRFTVTVIDVIPKKVSRTKGEPVVLQPNIADIEIYDVIEWMFEAGETAIARINKQISANPWYDDNDERFRGRLKLDQSGSLTITNTTTTDSGLYKLQVTSTNIDGKHRRFRVVVSEPGPFTEVIIGVIVGIAVIAVIAVAVICFHKQRSARSPL